MNKKKKNELTVQIGKRIAAFRKKAGLSQQDLEDLTSKNGMEIVRYRTLSLIEQGYGEPKISTLHAIACALNVPLNELLSIQSLDTNEETFDNFHFLLKKMSPLFLKAAYQQVKALAVLSDETKQSF